MRSFADARYSGTVEYECSMRIAATAAAVAATRRE
jgi:hypothetical protein